MADMHAVITTTRKLLSPAAPGVLALLGTRAPDIEPLRTAVEVDPVLTVKIMDHANHSFYARKVPVASLRRALVRLGWESSCRLLTRLLLEGASERVDPTIGRPIWEHSLRVAVLTRLLAKEARIVDTDLAYTAGLVHGIGQLGLVALLQQRYIEIWRSAVSGPHLARAEREAFGFDHAKVGAGVLEQLALPGTIPAAILRMYKAKLHLRDWDADPAYPLAALLQLSQFLLHDDGKRLRDPQWLARRPLAQRLHLQQSEDLAGRFDRALLQGQERAA